MLGPSGPSHARLLTRDEGRGAEEEVESKGGAVRLRGMEAEAVGDGDTLKPRGGALADRAIEQAAAALRGGCGIVQDQEISRGEGSTGGRCERRQKLRITY